MNLEYFEAHEDLKLKFKHYFEGKKKYLKLNNLSIQRVDVIIVVKFQIFNENLKHLYIWATKYD